MNKLNLSLKEILIVLCIPVTFLLLFQLSYEIITMVYMMIVTLLGTVDISYQHKGYGDVIYKSKSFLICQKNCLMMIWIMQLLMYVFITLTQWPGIMFACLQSLILVVIIKQQLSMIFFTKGLHYRGSFYPWKDIKEAYHVKNYKAMYEIHIGYSTVIRLTGEELALAKEVG